MPDTTPRRALIARLLVPFAALAVPLAQAEIYKWVDEKGVTQYTETPPPSGGKATRIDTPSAPRSETKAAPGDVKEKASPVRPGSAAAQSADPEAEAKAKALEQDPEYRSFRCARAKGELKIYNSPEPVYLGVNSKGEKMLLADADRPAAIVTSRKEVETYCAK